MWEYGEMKDLSAIIYDRIKFHGGLSLEDIRKGTGKSPQTIRKHMKRLVEAGKVTLTVGEPDNPHWRFKGDSKYEEHKNHILP